MSEANKQVICQVLMEKAATDKENAKLKDENNNLKIENRSIEETLNLGWELLSQLPREDLDRVDDETILKYYKGNK